MATTKPGPNGSVRFAELRLNSLPSGVADGVRGFLEEDISSYNLFDRRALRRTSDLPDGTKIFKGSDPYVAFSKAARSHMLKSFLRTAFHRQQPAFNRLLMEGSETIAIVSMLTRRSADVEQIIMRANLLASEALSEKLQAGEDAIKYMRLELCASAGFLAAMKALDDVDFTRKEEFMAHALERWGLIEKGFGIYVYDRGAPYLYCIDEDGTASLSNGNGIPFQGPPCAP